MASTDAPMPYPDELAIQVGIDEGRRRVLLANVGGFMGMYLELSAIPYIAARHGGRFAAGLLTFALMATTIAMQAMIPRLLRRFSARGLFATGLVLIGAPSLLYSLSQSVPILTAITLIRGGGFGLITVLGSTLTATYSRPGARGSALGAYGVATTLSAAFAPALGVAVSRVSIVAISVLGTVPPLLGLIPLVKPLPPEPVHAPRSVASPAVSRLPLALTLVVFTPVAVSIAAGFTFVPLLRVGPVLLMLFGIGFTSGRFLAGQLLDRGHLGTLMVLVLLAALVIGLVLLGAHAFAAAAVGAAGSGLGSGCLCTATLVMMFDRAGPAGMARASVLWNFAFDVGQAVGAVALGAVGSLLGPSGVFVVTAGVVMVIAVPAAAFDWRRVREQITAPA